MYLKKTLFYDVICSVTIKFHEIATKPTHGIWGELNLCSQAMATQIQFQNKASLLFI